MPERVTVTRDRGDWRKIEVESDQLDGWHIATAQGGHGARLPHRMLAAYMSCEAIPDGAAFAHSCAHGPPPHRIKVLIQKVDNPPAVYRRLRGLAERGSSAGGSA